MRRATLEEMSEFVGRVGEAERVGISDEELERWQAWMAKAKVSPG